LITFIDGFIDITFKVKQGETSIDKISKDFKEHMEKTREENMQRMGLPKYEGVRKRN